jgi:hypothetical protein
MVMQFSYLFRCAVFRNTMMARMVGQNMVVS